MLQSKVLMKYTNLVDNLIKKVVYFMEWNSGTGAQQPANRPAPHAGHKKKISFLSIKTASVGLLFSIAILIVAIASLAAFGGPENQGKFVDDKKMQAVFLNGGQVYFGRITDLNDKFMRVSDIYYLRVNQTVQPDQADANGQQATSNDISLVKLGCELHGPQDSMVINQDQVIFWENLKDDGQVAKAVATYKEKNPDGQKCETNTQSDNSSTPTTTPTTTPATNKKSN